MPCLNFDYSDSGLANNRCLFPCRPYAVQVWPEVQVNPRYVGWFNAGPARAAQRKHQWSIVKNNGWTSNDIITLNIPPYNVQNPPLPLFFGVFLSNYSICSKQPRFPPGTASEGCLPDAKKHYEHVRAQVPCRSMQGAGTSNIWNRVPENVCPQIFCSRLWGSWLWFGDITVRSLGNWFLHILALKSFP